MENSPLKKYMTILYLLCSVLDMGTIITNKKHKFAVQGLKTLGIYDYFEGIIGGDDITCLKPSSCPLDRTIEKLKIDQEVYHVW